MRLYITIAIGLLVALVASMISYVHAQPAGDDFKQTKEWKELNRYVCTWEDHVSFTVPPRKPGRGTNTAAWTLGGRFLHMEYTSEDGFEALFLLSYDQNRRAVRYWSFNSGGQALAHAGKWDEATRTFTFKAEDTGPMTFTSTDRFIDDDHREWKNTLTDEQGKVVLEVLGNATRRK